MFDFERIKTLAGYLSLLLREVRFKAVIYLALLLTNGITQGFGLLMLVPLLELVGVGQGQVKSGVALKINSLFNSLGISLTIPTVMAVFLCLVAVTAMANYLQEILSAQIINGFVYKLRARLFATVTYVRWLTFVRSRSSDVTHIMASELQRVGVLTHFLLNIIANTVLVISYFFVAFTLSPRVTFMAMGAGLCLLAILFPFQRMALRLGQRQFSATQEMFASVADHLGGMKIMKAYGAYGAHIKSFDKVNKQMRDQVISLSRARGLSQLFFRLGSALAMVAFFYLTLSRASLPTSSLLLVVFIFARFMPLFSSLQNHWQNMMNALPAFTASVRMQERFEQAAEPVCVPEKGLGLNHALTLDQVSFSYAGPGGKHAVSHVSFKVPARRMTALVGPSGSGKSTTADIILGLLRPDQGGLFIDGRPLDDQLLHAWRASIGYVPQDTFLFHDTVRMNLLWAAKGATEDDLHTVLGAAAALEFVQALPRGLDTVIGDRGVRLSGGERQRLALARTLLRRPSLLLLDEATSSLDNESERHIQRAVEQLHGQMTILIIAHRLSTVRSADQIVVLDGGKVVESGNWQELEALEGGKFRALLQAHVVG